MRLIDADALIEFIVEEAQDLRTLSTKTVGQAISKTPTIDAVPVIRCNDCKHQEKYFHTDGRRKGGGYYIYGCELAEGYSHVCLDDDFCSRAERKEE